MRPHGYSTVFDGPAVRVVYQDADEHIHELWYRPGTPWSHGDLTALAAAPPAEGDPYGYFTSFDGPAPRVVYRGLDHHIHELWYRPGTPWSHGDLSALAQAPAADGDPMGYFTSFDGAATRVVYRGVDEHIHELWYRLGAPWRRGDLTSLARAPLAEGDPFGYFTGFDGPAVRVVYRGLDHQIHEIWYRPGQPWGVGTLTAIAKAPPAAGNPMGYFTSFDGAATRVVYRGVDEHIHELWYRPGTSWRHGDLTAIAKAPPAAGDPFGYVTVSDGPAARVVYRGMDHHVHELWYRPGTSWRHGDLTALAGAPLAHGDPRAYATNIDGPATRVVHEGLDHHVHELWYRPGGSWSHGDLTALARAPVPSLQ